jgi:deoxyribodipyrimidine photo-lyase
MSAAPDPSNRPVLVWFRDDLRLSDHPALTAAAARGAPVICLYVLGEHGATTAGRPIGAASKWWLAQSLRAVAKSLAGHGCALVLRQGNPADVIAEVMRGEGVREVFWNEIDNAADARVAADVAHAVEREGGGWRSYHGDLLVRPAELRNKDGRGLRVFTPFWKRVLARGDVPAPLPVPKLRHSPPLASDDLAAWALEPTHPDWAGGLRESWTVGEVAAQQRLQDFLADEIASYANERDRPDRDVTSRLSPHLRFGEISPRQVWHAARFAAEERPALGRNIEKFLSELGWREFCRHLLHDHADLATRNLQDSFDAFPWRHDTAALRAWQQGRTGYPIVDAGMRQLWRTGVMHNRVRMVVASFLIKHLLIDWRRGEEWFWDTLVDADAGNNPANWQWVAGSGADAAPYFRIFNPVLQGEKFDPDGAYVARWVPELAKLSPQLIHQPWKATPIELAGADVRLDDTYPSPIVDHAMARTRALDAYGKTRA